MRRRLALALGALLLCGGAVAQQAPQTPPDKGPTQDVTDLVNALASPGGIYTVFAPTDDAFKAVPAATLDKLGKDQDLLKSVLTFHLVQGKTESAAVTGAASVATLNGAKLNLAKAGDFVTVDDGMVVTADVKAGDSVIHIVDRVLMPPVKK